MIVGSLLLVPRRLRHAKGPSSRPAVNQRRGPRAADWDAEGSVGSAKRKGRLVIINGGAAQLSLEVLTPKRALRFFLPPSERAELMLAPGTYPVRTLPQAAVASAPAAGAAAKSVHQVAVRSGATTSLTLGTTTGQRR